MGLEVAPFVQDFVTSNPISGDDVNQGDDHIRLMKTTLKATFPTATKAIYAAVASAETANFTIVAGDENTTFMVDATAGAVVATLPTLLAADHGWSCYFVKMDSTNTFHIVPASGSVYSGPHVVTKARRCIPGTLFGAYWSGSNWLIERCERAPVGTLLAFQGAAAPAGYELAYGQTLASASTNYQEFYSVNSSSAVVRDLRGRAPFGKSNMGGSDNGLLSSITGTTLGSTGGAQTLAISQANLPSVNFTVSGSASVTGSCSGNTSYLSASDGQAYTHSHTGSVALSGATVAAAFGGNWFGVTSGTIGLTIDAASHDHYHNFSGTSSGSGSISGSAASGGSGTAYNKLPPAIVLNFILVVE